MKQFLQAYATPYDLSGPCPTASLATLLNGLKINNKRGDEYRKKLLHLTQKTIYGLKQMGLTVLNSSYFPIIFVKIGDNNRTIETANLLFDEGILVTVSPYPMVPKGEEGHRITITAANTEEEVDYLLKAFHKVKDLIAS